MQYFKVTLLRSGIGMPKRINGILYALGLHKRMRTVYHPVSPDIAGMIMKVKELVSVSEVDYALTRKEQHELRKPPKGYYVETRAEQAGRI
ncbi:mitochondrial 54S ribosomal protein YmL33 [Kalaharituber pfeilii]|nr:mitochondrial 54S ribosomal protein YmL33 [Kalaharituber pfeilii]